MTAHPSVIFINAITSFPQFSERRCYPDEATAWDDLCGYQPYNNTMVRATRCEAVHCPHGCTTTGPRESPAACAAVLGAVDGPTGRTIAPDGRFQCPQCRAEFIPGQPPGITVEALATLFRRLGLTGISLGTSTVSGAHVTGIIPPNPDTGGRVIKVTETHPRVTGPDDDPGEMREPLRLTVVDPHDRSEVDVLDDLIITQVTDMIARYL